MDSVILLCQNVYTGEYLGIQKNQSTFQKCLVAIAV